MLNVLDGLSGIEVITAIGGVKRVSGFICLKSSITAGSATEEIVKTRMVSSQLVISTLRHILCRHYLTATKEQKLSCGY